jgi:ATP-binding cassette subfamily C protein
VLGWRLLPAVALPGALGLTEGAGLVLLLPLLQRLGLDVQQGGAGRIAAAVERSFEAVGIPMTLETVLAAVLVLSSTHALLSARQLMLQPALDRVMLRHYRQRLYEAFLCSEWALAARGRVSDRVHAVMTDVERITALTYQALNLTAGVVLFVVYLAVALRVSAGLTGLVILCGLGLLVVQRRGGRESSEASRRYADTSATLHHLVSESLGGLKTLKSYGAEGRTAARARDVDERLASTYMAAMRGFARAKLWFDLGSTAALVFVL